MIKMLEIPQFKTFSFRIPILNRWILISTWKDERKKELNLNMEKYQKRGRRRKWL